MPGGHFVNGGEVLEDQGVLAEDVFRKGAASVVVFLPERLWLQFGVSGDLGSVQRETLVQRWKPD